MNQKLWRAGRKQILSSQWNNSCKITRSSFWSEFFWKYALYNCETSTCSEFFYFSYKSASKKLITICWGKRTLLDDPRWAASRCSTPNRGRRRRHHDSSRRRMLRRTNACILALFLSTTQTYIWKYTRTHAVLPRRTLVAPRRALSAASRAILSTRKLHL